MKGRSKYQQVALASLLAALYVILTLFPFSSFIGGAGFITANVIIIPVIAYLLDPQWALLSGFLGGLIITMLRIGLSTVFSAYAIIIPAGAAFLGSFGFRRFKVIPILFLLAEGFFYIASYRGQSTMLWLVHYAVACMIFITGMITRKSRIETVGAIAVTAMCENALMNIGSIVILQLPWFLWDIIAPISWLERLIATFFASILIAGIKQSRIA